MVWNWKLLGFYGQKPNPLGGLWSETEASWVKMVWNWSIVGHYGEKLNPLGALWSETEASWVKMVWNWSLFGHFVLKLKALGSFWPKGSREVRCHLYNQWEEGVCWDWVDKLMFATGFTETLYNRCVSHQMGFSQLNPSLFEKYWIWHMNPCRLDVEIPPQMTGR